VGVAIVPLNPIVLLLWVEPKLLPTIFMDVPTGPFTGLVYEIVGVNWAWQIVEIRREERKNYCARQAFTHEI
jgi:hypothetical protein